jgi:hypothetical protein
MIRKSMPSGFDPTGGGRLSEKIMLKQKELERDVDRTMTHPALRSTKAYSRSRRFGKSQIRTKFLSSPDTGRN